MEDKKFFDRTSLKMIDIIRGIRIIIESILLYFTKVSSVVKICFLFFFGIKMNDKIGDAMKIRWNFAIIFNTGSRFWVKILPTK